LPDQDFRLPLAHGDLRFRLLDCNLRGSLLNTYRRRWLLDDNASAPLAGCGGLLALLRRDALHGVAAGLLVALALQSTRLLESDWGIGLLALLKSRHQAVALWTGGSLLRLVGRLRHRHRG
jgi:hypothetical protein